MASIYAQDAYTCSWSNETLCLWRPSLSLSPQRTCTWPHAFSSLFLGHWSPITRTCGNENTSWILMFYWTVVFLASSDVPWPSGLCRACFRASFRHSFCMACYNNLGTRPSLSYFLPCSSWEREGQRERETWTVYISVLGFMCVCMCVCERD